MYSLGVGRGGAAFASMLVALALATVRVAGAQAQTGDSDNGIEQKAQLCFACHGPQGASTNPKYPVIAGQQQYYLYLQLKDFKAGRRENEEMKPIMESLSSDDFMPLAEYYSRQRWPSLRFDLDPAQIAAGEVAAGSGECPQCHLGGFNGASAVPRLAGQQVAYLQKTMLDFKAKRRNNQPAMSSLMGAFSDEDIGALAQYIASLTVSQSSSSAEID